MAVGIINKIEQATLREVLKELRNIRGELRRFMLLIPTESIKEYTNVSEISSALRNAVRKFPPQ